MKILSLKCYLLVFVICSANILAQPLFTEDFESGTPSSSWEVFYAGEEELTAVPMTNVPQPLANGGNYVGFLQDIDFSYTGFALSVAGETTWQNYSIEGDVYCYVNHPYGSAYTGLAFYCDSTIGTYIKLAADFDADQRIRLYNNHLDLITFQYTFEHSFTASDLPGGIPTVDGWHHMKVEIQTLNSDTTAFWCYFDGQMLLGCPIYDTGDDRMASGQIGVFSFSPGSGTGLEGYFDNIVVNPLSIVPVELTSFTAKVNDNNIVLNWSTSTETNNSGFAIERKCDSGSYVKIGFVPGKGTITEQTEYSFIDRGLQPGEYLYRLKQIDFDGQFEYSNSIEVNLVAPNNFELSQNYPNPFNPMTRIDFRLPVTSFVTVKVFDLLGREIKELINNIMEPGFHTIDFDGLDLNSGVYFYRITAINQETTLYSETKRMILMK